MRRESPGTTAEALELAQRRWAELWWFDLPLDTWQSIFAQYQPGEVIHAIKLTRSTKDRREEVIYRSLLFWLDRIVSHTAPNY